MPQTPIQIVKERFKDKGGLVKAVKALATDRVGEAAASYRSLLEELDCRVLSEKKNPGKQRVTFIFRHTQKIPLEKLKELVDTKIDPQLKGSVDWEID